MNACWKCGRPVESGMECEEGCLPSGEVCGAEDEWDPGDWAQIDWDKVQTLEDLKTIVRALALHDQVYKKSENWELLRRFVREEDL
jgi:hypothetical protein